MSSVGCPMKLPNVKRHNVICHLFLSLSLALALHLFLFVSIPYSFSFFSPFSLSLSLYLFRLSSIFRVDVAWALDAVTQSYWANTIGL